MDLLLLFLLVVGVEVGVGRDFSFASGRAGIKLKDCKFSSELGGGSCGAKPEGNTYLGTLLFSLTIDITCWELP